MKKRRRGKRKEKGKENSGPVCEDNADASAMMIVSQEETTSKIRVYIHQRVFFVFFSSFLSKKTIRINYLVIHLPISSFPQALAVLSRQLGASRFPRNSFFSCYAKREGKHTKSVS